MRRFIAAALLVSIAVSPASAALSESETKRIAEAATVLSELHAAPDQDVPLELWQKASCVMVIPGLRKAAFIVGGEYGKGLMSCRSNGSWTPPVFMRLGKGSWGLQFGAQTIDLVLLIMNDKGVEKLLKNRVSLGAEASVAAGPVGRDARAATDMQLKAEILSYSRTQGIFAGINLSGGVLRDDVDDNIDLYGKGITPRQVLLENRVQLPGVARAFVEALNR
ncbi:MAG TPA: lipid-binding SYLF domain-containing protein [Vicinamibacterales bacterium]|nr:lipid-binding SYLF domain-containing protein [Vicinamibacterales bacterium]